MWSFLQDLLWPLNITKPLCMAPIYYSTCLLFIVFLFILYLFLLACKFKDKIGFLILFTDVSYDSRRIWWIIDAQEKPLINDPFKTICHMLCFSINSAFASYLNWNKLSNIYFMELLHILNGISYWKAPTHPWYGMHKAFSKCIKLTNI